MRYLDDDSHTGDMGSSAWIDHNSYFLPPSKCHRRGGLFWLIPAGSASAEPGATSDWYTKLEDPEKRAAYRAFWDHWMTWARDHAEFLNVRRDLFLGEGAQNSLEGTAHCRGDRGFIFLRNATPGLRVAQLPINHWLGLDQGPWFELTQRHPT